MKRLSGWLSLLVKDEKGGVLVLVAVLIVALLGTAALAVDVGALYQAKRELVNAADAASLAGAQQLYYNLTGVDNQDARTYAEGYATGNYNCDLATASLNNYEVEVITEKNVELYFARFIGIDDFDVSARAVAKIGSLKHGKIMPFGISKSLFDTKTSGQQNFVDFEHEFGAGNWGWVLFHLPQTPATTVSYLVNGYDASLNDPINTNTGTPFSAGQSPQRQQAENALEGYKQSGEELWVPITGSMGPGASSPSTIVGFAVIVIEDYYVGTPTAATTISGKIISGIFGADELDTKGDYSTFYPSGVALIE